MMDPGLVDIGECVLHKVHNGNNTQEEFCPLKFPMRTIDDYQKTVLQVKEDTDLFH